MSKTNKQCYFVCDICGEVATAPTSDVKEVGNPVCPNTRCRNSEKGMPETTRKEYLRANFIKRKTNAVVRAARANNFNDIKELVETVAAGLTYKELEAQTPGKDASNHGKEANQETREEDSQEELAREGGQTEEAGNQVQAGEGHQEARQTQA